MTMRIAVIFALLLFSCIQQQNIIEEKSRDQQWIFDKEILRKILKESDLHSDTLSLRFYVESRNPNQKETFSFDTLKINHKVVFLFKNVNGKNKNTFGDPQINLIYFSDKVQYQTINLALKKKEGEFLIDALTTLNNSPSSNLFLAPLKSDLDVIKRVLIDVDLDRNLRTSKQFPLKISQNIISVDSVFFQNFILLKNSNDLRYKMEFIYEGKMLKVRLSDKKRQHIIEFDFIKKPDGYYLSDKMIAKV